MPNIPDRPTIFDTAMQTLNEKEINWISERKEYEAYQKLDEYIDDITSIVKSVNPDSRAQINFSCAFYQQVRFHGIEFPGNVPQYDELQVEITLLRKDPADSEKTTADVMVSMVVYPADPLHSNEKLLSCDYILGNNLLVKKVNRDVSSNIVPSEPTFEENLRNIGLIVSTAKGILQGLSL